MPRGNGYVRIDLLRVGMELDGGAIVPILETAVLFDTPKEEES